MKQFLNKLVSLPVELWQSRKLIWKLAKMTLKQNMPVPTLALSGLLYSRSLPYWYTGSYLKRASVQRLRCSNQVWRFPFVVYLTSGLVPWFFFSEAVSSSTNALIEYNYLVKKVVFKISILPLIKILAACFIHVFFVGVLLVIYLIYGYPPSLYLLQLIYYSFCMFVLVLAMSYTLCSVVVFFRDLSQIVAIALQIGMWATPIMWSFTRVEGHKIAVLFKLNPLYYIVTGYRESLFDHRFFWQDTGMTIYFWAVTLLLFAFGTFVFKRLKPHFADVL